MEETIAPGTLLARRYRLDELLFDVDGAQAWKGHDVVLGRVVDVNVIPVTDERAEPLAASAREAAAVHDPRFLRVLDAAVHHDALYVVREWVRGRPLAALVAAHPLSPTSAGVLAREVASAVAAAHDAGMCHLRLNPNSVLISDDGAVKITGLATEAVLHGVWCEDEAAEDARGIGRVLYAALTARWPSTPGSEAASFALAEAPLVDGRVARPRQVRAGVPRELDAVVERILDGDPRGAPALDTPRAVAQALATVVPTTGRGLPYLGDLETDIEITQPGADALPLPADDHSPVAAAAPPRAPTRPARPQAQRSGERRMSRLVGVLAGALLLIGAALVGWQLLTAAFPSFQLAGAGGSPSAANASSAAPTPSAARTPEPVPIAAMADFDPAGDPPEENPDRVDNAFDDDPETTWSTQTYFDPLELLKPGVGLAVDLGDATEVSAVRLALSGAGADVEVRAAAPGAQSAPTTLDAWQEVLSGTGVDANPVLELDEPVETRFLLLWFTKLPPVGEDYRLEVAEVEVLS